jgi:hypothetical protein
VKRDANMIRWKNGFLIHACDSAGGIGNLNCDLLKVPVETTAKYTLRTALMEVISIGAKPISASLEFANGPEYVQKAIVEVQKVLDRFSIPVVISTEKNFIPAQTGIGASVVGFADELLIGGAQKGAEVFVAGLPMVGSDLIKNEDLILSFEDFLKIRKCEKVGEIIPVGSKGIFEEALLLAKNSEVELKLDSDEEWFHRSAGPSTCIVFWSSKRPEIEVGMKRIGIFI